MLHIVRFATFVREPLGAWEGSARGNPYRWSWTLVQATCGRRSSVRRSNQSQHMPGHVSGSSPEKTGNVLLLFKIRFNPCPPLDNFTNGHDCQSKSPNLHSSASYKFAGIMGPMQARGVSKHWMWRRGCIGEQRELGSTVLRARVCRKGSSFLDIQTTFTALSASP
jgi:hypothetical protein